MHARSPAGFLRRAALPLLWVLPAYLAGAPPAAASRDPDIPGRLVDVGGYRLHIYCEGQGTPAIIFDSGTGGFSLEWMKVQKVLARRTRVCSYDRAGYGWSDMGPLPRTSARITRELHTLLEKAGIAAPYILAGHSFGGYTAQLFARNYPGETAGLVLIDSSHPEQDSRLPERKSAPPRRDLHRAHSYIVTRHVLHPNFPASLAITAGRIMRSRHHTRTWREEMMVFSLSARQVQDSRPMPAVPLVVLTRGRRVWPNNEYGDEMERVWMELQDELSRLSDDRVHLIAERSGHVIHLDQPEIVITAVQNLLDANFPNPAAGAAAAAAGNAKNGAP